MTWILSKTPAWKLLCERRATLYWVAKSPKGNGKIQRLDSSRSLSVWATFTQNETTRMASAARLSWREPRGDNADGRSPWKLSALRAEQRLLSLQATFRS